MTRTIGPQFLINARVAGSHDRSSVSGLANGWFAVAWSEATPIDFSFDDNHVSLQIVDVYGVNVGSKLLVSDSSRSPILNIHNQDQGKGNFLISYNFTDINQKKSYPLNYIKYNGSKSVNLENNSISSVLQFSSLFTRLKGGGYIAVREQDTPNGLWTWDVYARRYSADGSPSGDAFRVNTSTAGRQHQAAVTALADGGFAIAWEDTSRTPSSSRTLDIRAQIYASDGTTVGSEILVTNSLNHWPGSVSIAGLSDGSVAICWIDFQDDVSKSNVKLQIVQANGLISEPVIELSAAAVEPALAPLADGRLVVTWFDNSSGNLEGQILDLRTHSVNLNGTPLADQYVGSEYNDILNGRAGNDLLDGGSGNDQLIGDSGNDKLIGDDGNDRLDGGRGADRLEGGAGNDTYIVDNVSDVVLETTAKGIDTVKASVSYALGASVENLTLTGSSNLSGRGNELSNTIIGNAGANILMGSAGNDNIRGGAGDDTLFGGFGKDVLTGGAGQDFFVFDTATSAANVDRLTDFNVGDNDKVQLSKAVFEGFAADVGSLTSDEFYAAAGATKAHDASDRVIYDTTSGKLFYDADGMGGAAAIQVAVLGSSSHPVLIYSDIQIVA